jgi:hypothetical protein
MMIGHLNFHNEKASAQWHEIEKERHRNREVPGPRSPILTSFMPIGLAIEALSHRD